MTIRSLILGFALAMFIASVTFFNDWVVAQTHLVGNHLPIGVFGIVVLLLMVGNPLIRLIRPAWVLSPAELAIITAMGLVVCGWAGSNFNRTFIGNMALPASDYRGQSAWQSTRVLSYVPGGSPEVAAGHIRDWDGLVDALAPARAEHRKALTDRLDADQLRLVERLAGQSRVDNTEREQLLRALNESMIEPIGGEDAAHPPLYQTIASSAEAPRVSHFLDQRQAALAKIEALLEERAAIQASLDAQRLTIAEELNAAQSELKAVLTQLREMRRQEESIRLELKASAEPSEALAERLQGLQASIAELESREKQLTQTVRELEKPLAPTQRELANVNWRLDHYRQSVQIMTRKANRAALVAMLPDVILPAPEGEGALLNHAEISSFATEKLVQGWDGVEPLRVRDIPWWTWWPTLFTWGGIAILLTVAILCLATIVHPQWSKRELLSYPIVRFIGEITEPGGKAGLPRVMSSKLFWIALGTVLAIHLLNGLATWYPEELIQIPLQFDFNPAKKIAPDMAKAPNSFLLFAPTLYFSALGFAFFLNKEISLSVGVSLLLWCFFAGLLIQNGIPVTNSFYGSGLSQMLRFGGYAGLAIIIAYTGRRYYLDVMVSALGKRPQASTPGYSVWAARAMIGCLIGAGIMMHLFLGLDWLLVILFIGCVLIMSIGMARVNVESGLFFFQPFWMPVGVIAAFLGASAIGPEALVALALASAVMMNDPRESAMPFFANALGLSDRVSKSRIKRAVPVFALLVIIGFGVAITATLYWQYTNGVSVQDAWARNVSRQPLSEVSRRITQLESRGELTSSNMLSGLERIGAASPDNTALMWIAVGGGLVLVTAFARLRLPWWPLHPLIFLVWGNYASSQFAFSFLLGWLVKVLVTKFGGAKGYRAALPFMVGMIAGELLAIFGWMIVGWIYYAAQGTTPTVYRILPG